MAHGLDDKVERRLIRRLTEACDETKDAVKGFLWLTHVVDSLDPDGLRVIWIFDTEANMAQAIRDGSERYIQHRTAEAVHAAGLSLPQPEVQVELDSEERCGREHGGDWEKRLSAPRVRH